MQEINLLYVAIYLTMTFFSSFLLSCLAHFFVLFLYYLTVYKSNFFHFFLDSFILLMQNFYIACVVTWYIFKSPIVTVFWSFLIVSGFFYFLKWKCLELSFEYLNLVLFHYKFLKGSIFLTVSSFWKSIKKLSAALNFILKD